MTITNNANTNNTVFTSNNRNLLVTNDLTTGNILFTSERHNIPPQVLGTLVAEEDPRSTNSVPRIRIKRMNDDGTLDRYLIRKKPTWRFFCKQQGSTLPTRITTADNRIDSVAEVLTYLNNLFTEVPATTSTILVFGPDDTIDAARDATNTTVLFDNGKEHAVNAIVAVENAQGLINVTDHATQQVHFQDIRHNRVTINGVAAGNSVTNVVNALNALFTVTAPGGAYSPVGTLPTLAGTAVTYTQKEATTPNTTDPSNGQTHLQVATGDDPHGSRFWSTEFVDEAGEYYDFKITGKGHFLMGFYEYGVDETDLNNDALTEGNDGLYWALSLFDYGTYMGPQTIYGTVNTGVQQSGWTGTDSNRYATNTEIQDNHLNNYSNLFRAGIDSSGHAYISYYDVGRSNAYIEIARTSAALPSEKKLGFVVKLINGAATLVDVPVRTATDPAGPTLYYRYIESPDGSFYYPLFATADEAAYVDIQNGGADPGSAHAHTFVDEPTGTVWYMPTNGGTHAGTAAPSDPPGYTYTEIPTEADSLHVPPAFSQLSSVVAPENTSGMNINLYTSGNYPSLGNYTTTISPTNPHGLVENGGYLQGTLPYVSADTTETVTVTRTNAFGSSTGTFTITIENRLTQNIAGWTVHQGTTVSPSTIKATEPAVLEYNTLLTPGTRVRIPFEQYMKFGIPNSTGIANKGTVDIFDKTLDNSNFDLLFTVMSTGSNNIVNVSSSVSGEGIGWDDNTQNNEYGSTTNDVYFIEYRDDNKLYVINNDSGELLLTSAATYGGSLPLYYGIPGAYSTDKTIPSITTESIEYTGAATTGFTKDPDSANLIDATTMTDGCVVKLDQAVNDNHRLVIRKEWIENNISAGLQSATGTSQFFIGLPHANKDWTSSSGGLGNVAAEDFQLAIGIAVTDTVRGSSWLLKMYKNGQQVHSIGVGGTGTNAIYDLVFSNVDGRWEMSIQNNFGTPVPTDASIALRQINGGSWGQTVIDDQSYSTGPQDIYLGAQNTTASLSLTGLEFYREPFLANDILLGESNGGNPRFSGFQPSAAKFDEHDGGHAPTSFINTPPTLAAGSSYRFIYHPSMEAADDVKVIRASDGSDYMTNVTAFGTGADDPDSANPYKGIAFNVPTDAPLLKLAYKNSHGGNTAYDATVDLPVSGSTYKDTAGAEVVGPTGNHTGDLVTGTHGWVELDITLNPGERVIFPPAWHQAMAAACNPDSNYVGGYTIGLASPANFDPQAPVSGTTERANYFAEYRSSHYRPTSSVWQGTLATGATAPVVLNSINGTYSEMNLVLELAYGGQSHRMMLGHSGIDDPTTLLYGDWNSNRKVSTGTLSSSYSNLKIIVKVTANGNGDDIDLSTVDFSLITKQAIPATSPTITDVTRGINFSGAPERMEQYSTSSNHQPLKMNGLATVVPLHADLTRTSNDANARPWAVTCVFKWDGTVGDQYIWAQSNGSNNTNDNIYLKVDSSNRLIFGWGRNTSKNEVYLGFTIDQYTWYGVYVLHKGQRYSANGATQQNLADAFDIRIMGSDTRTGYSFLSQFQSITSNYSTLAKWSDPVSRYGSRMDRAQPGTFCIGGRLAYDNFHGIVAQCVVTTIRSDQPVPTEPEIKLMIADPMKWLTDYKVGQPFRLSWTGGDAGWNFGLNQGTEGRCTQVWLMGDGASDVYPDIRNEVHAVNNEVKQVMKSMVSNDIEFINIPGLT